MTGGLLFLIIILIIAASVVAIIYANKKAKRLQTVSWFEKQWKKDSVKATTSSFISVFVGLLIGAIILLAMCGSVDGGLKTGLEGVQLIFFGVFNIGRNASGNLVFGWNGTSIGNVLFKAMPLILTGLSVALAFKTGLFNIGAPGQYLMGTAASLIVALSIPTTAVPAWIVWILAFLSGMLAGALWGAIPGLFKAFLNVNEVISCIMTNWIAANLVTALFDNSTGPFKNLLDPSGTKNFAYVYKTTHNGVATPSLGLDKIFPGSQVNAGIFVAIIIAIVVYIVLNKTTFGYELKACGANRDAAKYAGINEKRNILLSMAIAGGLAGAGAALYYLSGNTEFKWLTYQSLPAIGFNGIPVALLASNNPVGVIASAIFLSYLDVAGMSLKYMTTYNEYITSIISAIIVYFSAFALLIKMILEGKIKISFFQNKNINKEVEIKNKEKPKEINESNNDSDEKNIANKEAKE